MNIIHIKQPFRRSYSLRLNEDGDLVVRTGASFTNAAVSKIIEKHKDWIDKRIREYEYLGKYRNITIDENLELNLLGENYRILFKDSKRKTPKIYFANSFITIEFSSLADLTQKDLKNALKKFLISATKDIFIERVYMYAKKYEFEYKDIKVKNVKSKWGSCSSKKNLNFDWKLIFCPKEVMDYVIIHEVCHLKEMNHSKRFWDLVSIESPNYKTQRKWLRMNGDKVKYMFS